MYVRIPFKLHMILYIFTNVIFVTNTYVFRRKEKMYVI